MDTKALIELENNTLEPISKPVILPMHSSGQRTNSYYRSKIFTSHIGINPLVTAASPLFSIAEKLKNSCETPELSRLHHDLAHEIKAFENKAQTLGYHSQVTQAARYLLCAWIDEIVLNSSWAIPQEWEKRRLINNFQHNTPTSNHFFALLEHCKQDPPVYIDLLELMYLCLCLGYEGDYRYLERGHSQLIKISDDLYETIRIQRGDFSKKLEIALATEQKIQVTKKSYLSLIPALITLLVLSGLSITIYLFLNQRLDKNIQNTYQSTQLLLNSFASEKSP